MDRALGTPTHRAYLPITPFQHLSRGRFGTLRVWQSHICEHWIPGANNGNAATQFHFSIRHTELPASAGSGLRQESGVDFLSGRNRITSIDINFDARLFRRFSITERVRPEVLMKFSTCSTEPTRLRCSSFRTHLCPWEERFSICRTRRTNKSAIDF